MLPRCNRTAAVWLAALVVACLSSLLTASIANARGWTAPALLAALPALLAVLAAGAKLVRKRRRAAGPWPARRWRGGGGARQPAAVTSGPFGAYQSAWTA